MISLALLMLAFPVAERDWSITIVGKGEAVAVAPLSPDEAAAWKANPPREAGAVFSLFVGKADLPMLGEWKLEGQKLLFVPRFPLVPGVEYRAVLNPEKLPAFARTRPEVITRTLQLPKPPRGPATVVEAVYPTADVLPENQLKFYLHFSAPMSRGDVYRHIRLLNADGKLVEAAFIQIDEELWDREGKRLTVLLDPGRIKRGLKPREEEGPILEEGKSYTLVIEAAWKDGEGEPLRESFRKRFKVVAPDDKQPDLAAWKVAAPRAETKDPLTLKFPESLDQALLHRLLWVVDAEGKRVPGTVTLGPREESWQWTPEAAWKAGEYRIVADSRLEDLAGNSLGRPFEVDIFRPVQRETVVKTLTRSFRVEK
jgi:hypothetical protein